MWSLSLYISYQVALTLLLGTSSEAPWHSVRLPRPCGNMSEEGHLLPTAGSGNHRYGGDCCMYALSWLLLQEMLFSGPTPNVFLRFPFCHPFLWELQTLSVCSLPPPTVLPPSQDTHGPQEQRQGPCSGELSCATQPRAGPAHHGKCFGTFVEEI